MKNILASLLRDGQERGFAFLDLINTQIKHLNIDH